MIQQDYIMRMIEQLGAFVRAIAQGRASRDELEGDLDEMAVECLGLPLVILLSLPKDEAFRLIEESERLVYEKAFLLGEMCFAKAAASQDPKEKADLLSRARYFFEKAQGRLGGEVELRIAARLVEDR